MKNQSNNKIQQDARQHLDRYLRSQSSRVTAQRKALLVEILQGPGHFDAEELFDRLRKGPKKVSRATIYRALAHFRESGIIRKVDLDPSHGHFEVIDSSNHHQHLRCEKCGIVVEFFDSPLEKRIDKVAQENGFELRRRQVCLTGLCRKCRDL